jgi:predicted hydrocarbon binding protein
MFKEERNYNKFSWEDIGDIKEGRPNLGPMVPVTAYRLFQYTMRDVLITEFNVEKTNDILRKAGKLAGEHFCRNLLNTDLELDEFVAELQKILKDLQIGILKAEQVDPDSLDMVLTVAEDLDCSGLPVCEEMVCQYDEGFIAGILKAYFGIDFHVEEVDCWASGDRVCRFAVKVLKPVENAIS